MAAKQDAHLFVVLEPFEVGLVLLVAGGPVFALDPGVRIVRLLHFCNAG